MSRFATRITGLRLTVLAIAMVMAVSCTTHETPSNDEVAVSPPPGLAQAEALMRAGRLDSALVLYQHFLTTGGEPAWMALAHTGVADVRARLGQLDAAVTHYQLALDLSPDEARIWHNYAVVRADQGRYGEADSLLIHTLRIDAGYLAALEMRALLAERAADHDSAEHYLRQALEVRTPPAPSSQRLLGRLLLRLGRYDEAEAQLRAAYQTGTQQGVSADSSGLARTLRMLGVIRADRDDHAAAIEWLQRSLAMEPTQLEAHYNLALSLRAVGRDSEAEAAMRRFHDIESRVGDIARWRRILDAEPTDAEARRALAAAYLDVGRKAEAMQQYRAGLILTPGDSEAAGQLCRLLAAAGRWEEADAVVDRLAYSAAAENVARVRAHLGFLQMSARRLGSAVANLGAAAAAAPDDGETWNNLGATYLMQGRADLAKRAFGAATRSPNPPVESLTNLANLQLGAGEIDAAILSLQRALAIDSTRADLRLVLGTVFVERDELEAAHEQFQRIADGGITAGADAAQVATAHLSLKRIADRVRQHSVP